MIPVRLTLYTSTVSLLGVAVLAFSLPAVVSTPPPLQWLLFSAVVLFASRYTLSIAAVEASISVSDTFSIASALLFGPGPAMLTLAVDGCLLSWRKHYDWKRVTFNSFAPALSLGVAAHVFFVVSRTSPLAFEGGDPHVVPLLLPLLLLTIIYFALNSGLMAIAVGLESGQPPRRVWWQHLATMVWSYCAAASTALCLVLVVQEVGVLALPIVAPILAEFHFRLRASFGRLTDAQRHVAEIDILYQATIETLAMAIDAKDTVTHSHVRRVQSLALALASALRVTDVPTLRALKTAALLHDTGKLAIPERILNKPGPLTVVEFEEMKRHVDVGADILSLVPFPFPVVPIVRSHHENWDGTGYPRGTVATDIPVGARILSVADCYDALTSDRPYRRRMTDGAALQIVRERRGTMYDPAVVDALVALEPHVRLAIPFGDGHADVLKHLRGSEPPMVIRSPGAPPREADTSPQPTAAGETARLADLLAQATSVVRQIAPHATGAWYLADPAGEHLHATAPFGDGAAGLQGRTIAMGAQLTGWVAVNRQSIVNSDAFLDLGDGVHAVTPPHARCLSMPILVGDALAGVLTLYAGEPHPFSDEQGGRLQRAARTLAAAIHNGRSRLDARNTTAPTAHRVRP